jgi:hypothetical protein
MSSAHPNAAKAATRNGAHAEHGNGTDADEARRQTMQRAEQLADQLGERVGQYVAAFGHNVLKWVARAREEAEDIWAEAQAIRERQRAANDQSEGAPPVPG